MVATIAWSGSARALAVTLRSRSSGRSITMTTTATERVNRTLCTDPEVFTFSITGLTIGQTLSIWRGTGCNVTTSRRDATQCEKVDDALDITATSRDLPLDANVLFDCTDTDAGTKAIWFLMAESEDPDQDVGAQDSYSIELGYDFSAPPAVSGSVTTSPGESSVELSWTAPSSTDIDGYVLLAEDLGATGADCSTATLVAGETPTQAQIDALDTVTVGKTAESGSVGGLEVNHTYAVAVVTLDESGNYGPVSPVECASTEPVTDFWEAYRAAGGQAATCAAAPGRSPAGTAGGAALAGCLALLCGRFLRSRRRQGGRR